MDSQSEGERLPEIRESIRHLYRSLGVQQLKSFATTFELGPSALEIERDPVIGVQRLARRIANHYRLHVTTVIVSYSTSLLPPGRVELGNSADFFIELQAQFKGDPQAVAAILAHEIAHIFLHLCGVKFSDEFEDEVLTDTTAVYLGFGPSILNAATRTWNKQGKEITRHFGYLSLGELGYVQAKRERVGGSKADRMIVSELGRTGLQSGRRTLDLEAKRWPYRWSFVQFFVWSVLRLFPHHRQGRSGSGQQRTVVFRCSCCFVSVR